MADAKPRGRVGITGSKMRMTRGLPTYAMLNCADNTGAKEMMIIAVKCVQGRQNRLPSASIAEMCVASCKKGKPDYRKKGLQNIYCYTLKLFFVKSIIIKFLK